jgi:hypothetical protein
MVELYLHSPIYLHGIVFSSLRTGIPLPYIIVQCNASIQGRVFLDFAARTWEEKKRVLAI